jgi:hypothetical protein
MTYKKKLEKLCEGLGIINIDILLETACDVDYYLIGREYVNRIESLKHVIEAINKSLQHAK